MTDFSAAEVLQWQTRPLCCRYPVMAFDALRVQVDEGGGVRDKTVHFALGMHPEGPNEILGLWIDDGAGEEFWFEVSTRLKERGVERIRVVVVDASTIAANDLRQALDATYPAAALHASIAHLMRRSLTDASAGDRKHVAAALQAIYGASSVAAAQVALNTFAASPWGAKYESIVTRWRAAWHQLVEFFALPRDVRRFVVLAAHGIGQLHAHLQRAIAARGDFTGDHAAIGFVWLAQNGLMQRRSGNNLRPSAARTARRYEVPYR